jgi:hypothetical protein
MSTFPIGSVIIPALNEATTIRRCLDALLIGFAPGELDVVVSCNGCTDGTANIVRSSWPAVQVIEVTKASKPAALRAADQALSVFPRIYLDADVVLPATSARQLLEYLRTGPALAARPPISYDTTDADAMVRSYYRARSRLFSLKRSLWGGGAYAVSAAGRARYDAYPEIIADDLFADKWFSRSEIEIIGSEPSVITVPRRAGDLFRVLRRKYLGNVQIQDLPEPPELTVQSTLRDLSAMVMSSPGAAVDAAVFLATVTAVRITLRLAPPAGWNRDDSSRVATTTLTLPAATRLIGSRSSIWAARRIAPSTAGRRGNTPSCRSPRSVPCTSLSQARSACPTPGCGRVAIAELYKLGPAAAGIACQERSSVARSGNTGTGFVSGTGARVSGLRTPGLTGRGVPQHAR